SRVVFEPMSTTPMRMTSRMLGPASEGAQSLAGACERHAPPRAPHEHALRRTRAILLLRAYAVPDATLLELPRGRRVREEKIHRRGDLARGADVLDGDEHLDAMVDVPRHEIGAPEVVARDVARLELEQPAVLEKAPEHATDADALAQARHAWTQRADAA